METGDKKVITPESGWIQRNPMNLKRQSPVTISMLLFTGKITVRLCASAMRKMFSTKGLK